ncbi:MAG: ABC transporter permease, partial [Anaerolineales bacterium]|nr:ABC transporter permease [Anaerolineales bacterium]
MSETVSSPSPSLRERFPYRLRVEPWLHDPPKWYPYFVSLIAVVAALVIGGILLALSGGDPLQSYVHIARASFGSLGVLSDTIVKATPLILVGLACTIAFRMKLWNIGAEGQLFMGALGASAVVLIPLLPADASPWLFIPVMIVAGVLTGALWGFIPGFLKARWGINEIITTLMMNYIALALVNFFIFGVWSEGGFQMSPKFPKNAWLPRLADYAEQIPIFRGLTTHMGLLIGLGAAVLVWYILYRSRWG